MVKLIILDVDGVIVGHKLGVNFPYPDKKVIAALKKIRKQGIPIVLCSGKSGWTIEPIILQANLDNPHISFGGGLINDAISKKIIRSFGINKSIVSTFINIGARNRIYIEAYSADHYFVQKDISDEIINQRALVLQKKPVITSSLLDETRKHEIIKLQAVITNPKDKEKAETLFKPLNNKLTFIWTMHPSTRPWEYYLATSPDASKAKAITEVAKNLEISLDEALGVGDTLGDWEFMKLCGYTAAMRDAPEDLKKLSQFVAPSVDEDGILKVLEHFL